MVRIMSKKNDISKQKDTPDTLEELNHNVNSLSASFKKISKVYSELNKKKPFYRQKSFWSILIFLSGFLGLIATWQQQIKVERTSQIKEEIATIKSIKRKENDAITESRVLIINQKQDCPVRGISGLSTMEKNRNSSLVGILAYASGLEPKENQKARLIVQKIVRKIYKIKAGEICNSSADVFDAKIQFLQKKLNTIFDEAVKNKQVRIQHIEDAFFVF